MNKFPSFFTENLSKLVGLYSGDTSFQINLHLNSINQSSINSGGLYQFLRCQQKKAFLTILENTELNFERYIKIYVKRDF